MRYKNSATEILFYNNRLILKSNQFLHGFGGVDHRLNRSVGATTGGLPPLPLG